MAFGGGTALMLMFNHRHSKDIDKMALHYFELPKLPEAVDEVSDDGEGHF
jgi:hypothetical protein